MRTKADFVAYLQETLIPDLRESGKDATADDFETLILFINGARGMTPWVGSTRIADYRDFRGFLKGTLIPDLRESGYNYTADDFRDGVVYADRVQGLRKR